MVGCSSVEMYCMNKLSNFFAVVLLSSAAILGCKKAPAPTLATVSAPTTKPSYSFVYSDSGTDVVIQKGGIIEVNLTCNQSVNSHKWVLLDHGSLVLEDESKKQPSPKQEDRRFIFRAITSGKSSLTFGIKNQFVAQDPIDTVDFGVLVP